MSFFSIFFALILCVGFYTCDQTAKNSWDFKHYPQFSILLDTDENEKAFHENWELFGVAKINTYAAAKEAQLGDVERINTVSARKFSSGGVRNYDRKSHQRKDGNTRQQEENELPNREIDSSTRFLELTPFKKSQKGSAWTRAPINLNGWEVTIQPDVLTPQHGVPGADGFAFWYTKDRGYLGDAFGSKEKYKGFSLSYDSFDNDHSGDNPALYLSYNTGEYEYNPSADGTELVMEHYKVNLLTYPQALIKIVYDAEAAKVEVFLDKKEKDTNEGFVQIMTGRIDVPTYGYYFGLSASTGAVMDAHRILKMSTYSFGGTAEPFKGFEKDGAILGRQYANRKEEILKKSVHLHELSTPKLLLDTSATKTKSQGIVAATLNHIYLRQYSTSLSINDRFETLHDVVTLMDGASSISYLEFRNQVDEMLVITANRSNIINEFGQRMKEIDHKATELNKYFGDMQEWQLHMYTEQDKEIQQKKATVSKLERSSAFTVVFYILNGVAFIQIIIIVIWSVAERKKRASRGYISGFTGAV